jgi:predicted ATPase
VKQAIGQMVLVAGEAGIGKTRLVREFADGLRAEHWIVLQGACFERDSLLPYAPVLDALRTMLTTLPPSDIERCLGPAQADLASLLPELGGGRASDSAVDPSQQKHRIFRAFEGVFLRLGAKQPLLLVLEDLHWADDSSLEFLSGFARSVARAPILALGTYRDIEVPARLSAMLEELDRSRSCIELRLTGLSRDEVGQMLRAIFRLERPIRQDFLQAIWTLTEGNPFFIEELLRSVVGTGDVTGPDHDWDRRAVSELRLPRTLQDAVRRRTERLSDAARSVLLLAAVSGRRFEFDLLQRVTRQAEAELLALMKELVGAQLLVEVDDRGDQFAFRHALTHQAVYGQLLGRERRALHRRVGETSSVVAAGDMVQKILRPLSSQPVWLRVAPADGSVKF